MRRYTSVGLSPLVAVILLIAITVAAAVVVSGVFFNLASIAGRRPTAQIDQVKLVANATTGEGLWVVVIKNTGDVPITSVSTANTPASCSPGNPTFAPLPVPSGATTAASATASGCTVGGTYKFTLVVTFRDGSQQRLAVASTATIA
jgi:flagellin-like protein